MSRETHESLSMPRLVAGRTEHSVVGVRDFHACHIDRDPRLYARQRRDRLGMPHGTRLRSRGPVGLRDQVSASDSGDPTQTTPSQTTPPLIKVFVFSTYTESGPSDSCGHSSSSPTSAFHAPAHVMGRQTTLSVGYVERSSNLFSRYCSVVRYRKHMKCM